MSRVRVVYALACFGILITTGGCSSSATAPEAVSAEASASRFKNPTADTMAASPETGGQDGYTVSSGLLNGGGRSAEMP